MEALAPLEGLPEAIGDAPIDVCVSAKDRRLQVRGVTNRVFAPAWFMSPLVRVTDEFAFATPEFLLFHLAASDSLITTALVAYEFCGTYSFDPLSKSTLYGVDSVCTADSVRAFIAKMPGKIRGRTKLIQVISYVRDNSWSPMESVLALLLCLPTRDGGYGIDDIKLNRKSGEAEGPCARIPDILLGNTHVGINYEGEGHFGTRDLARAAHVAATDGSSESFELVENASRNVRTRIVADKQRDRDLILAGYRIVTVSKEDLHSTAHLDQLIWQVVKFAAEEQALAIPTKASVLGDAAAKAKRRNLIRQMLQGVGA